MDTSFLFNIHSCTVACMYHYVYTYINVVSYIFFINPYEIMNLVGVLKKLSCVSGAVAKGKHDHK